MNEAIKMHLVTLPYRESSIHMQIYEWLHYHLSAKNPKNSNSNTNALTFLKCNYKYKRRSILSESIKLSRSRKRVDPSIVASKAPSRESMLRRESRKTNNSATRVILRLLMAITGQLMKRHTSTSMSTDASATSASTSDVINNQVIDNIVSTRYYSGKLTLNKTQKKSLTHASKQSMQSLSLLPLLSSLPSMQSLQPPKGIPKTQPFNSRNRFNMLDTTTTKTTTTTATSSSMTALNSLRQQQHEQPSDARGSSNSPSSKAVLVNRHCQHRQQKQQHHHQHQRHQPEVLSMFMALFIALTLCARSAEAGACWQTALGNGKCKEIFARNSSRADCCVSGRELFYTERELTDVEYFFASAIGEGIECAPCMETCKNVDCGPNKKCVKRKGRAKCICAPECGAALRQRQRQQQQQQGHYRNERIYRGHQHHNEQWHNDQSAPEGVTTVSATSAAAASAAAAIAAWAAKSPRDIRSLSSEITNINLGTDGDIVALETSGQQQSSQKSQHQNQRKIIVMQSQSQEKPQIRTRKDQKPRRLLVDSHPQSEYEEKTTTRRLQIIANVRGNGRGTGHRRRLNDKTSSIDDDVVTAAATDYRHQQRHNNNKNHNNNNDKSIIKGHSNELVHSKQRHHHQHNHRQHKQHNRNHNNRVRGMHQTIDGDRDSSNYDAIEVERKHEARERERQQQQQNHRKRKHHNRSKHRKPKDPNANINSSNSSTNDNNNNHDISVFAAIYNAKFPTAPTPAATAAAAAGTGTATLQTTAATTTPVNSSSSADHQKHLFNHGSNNIATSSSTLSSSSTSLWSSSTNNTLNPPVAPTTTTVEGGNALNALTLLDGIYNNYNLHGFPLQKEQHRFMFDSTHHNAHPVCGSDGRTYNTECQLKKRACRTDNSNLQVAYRGHCKTSCNGVKCLNGFTCVEDHYTIPHCIACKIECSDEDDDHYAFNNDARHRGTVADVTVAVAGIGVGVGVGVGRDVAKGIDAATSRAVCGVDGKTYKSTCDINRMICKIGRSIAVAYPGPCRADRVTCNDISCGPKYTCLVDLLTHEPRCVYCRYKCSRKRRPSSLRFEEGKICGVNNRTYSSWCEMRKDSCNTGFFIDVKAPGECQ